MGKLADTQATPIASTFGFSAVDIDQLGASEYTLVAVATDCSGSVASFRAEEEQALGEIVEACRKSPRADNLLLRLTRFDQQLVEVHGFKPLPDCNPSDYRGVLPPGGTTALFDAAVNAVEAVTRYGKDLVDNDFSVNGIVFVITDGADNASTQRAGDVQQAIARAVQSESLESIVTVLIGVNVQDRHLAQLLADFSRDAGFAQYIELGQADAKTLARLAAFISKSISSQSQALGTGGPSQALTF
jgi:uncharacterized protein YegL